MQAMCPQCDTPNPIGNKFCGSCGASLATAKVVKKASQTEARAQSDSQEITYYSSGSVLVTSTRAVFGAKTYAVANITSVAMAFTPPKRLLGYLVVLAGLVFFIVGLLGATADDGAGIAALAIGVIIVGVGLFLAVRAKRRYIIQIASASGETEALVSRDRDYIERIVAALQKAIAERG